METINATDSFTRHFVLTGDGTIREFTPDEAVQIATGADRLPEFADAHLRYLQVSWSADNEDELRVRTAGAAIRFDSEGRIIEINASEDGQAISRFEHDTCVQWALRELIPASLVLN